MKKCLFSECPNEVKEGLCEQCQSDLYYNWFINDPDIIELQQQSDYNFFYGVDQ